MVEDDDEILSDEAVEVDDLAEPKDRAVHIAGLVGTVLLFAVVTWWWFAQQV